MPTRKKSWVTVVKLQVRHDPLWEAGDKPIDDYVRERTCKALGEFIERCQVEHARLKAQIKQRTAA